MDRLQGSLAQRCLSDATAMPLHKQLCNDRRFNKESCEPEYQLPAVLVPEVSIAKLDFAAGGQACLADPPPLHFAPVKLQFVGRRLQQCSPRRRPHQDLRDELSRFGAVRSKTVKVPPDDPTAEKLIEETVDGSVRRRGYSLHGI